MPGIAAIKADSSPWAEARRRLVAALTCVLELITPPRLDLEIDAVISALERGTRAAHVHAMAPLVSPKAAVLVRHLQLYQVSCPPPMVIYALTCVLHIFPCFGSWLDQGTFECICPAEVLTCLLRM